jgi:hypothetical protein
LEEEEWEDFERVIMMKSEEINEWHRVYSLNESTSARHVRALELVSTPPYRNLPCTPLRKQRRSRKERLELLVIRAPRFSLGANAFT